AGRSAFGARASTAKAAADPPAGGMGILAATDRMPRRCTGRAQASSGPPQADPVMLVATSFQAQLPAAAMHPTLPPPAEVLDLLPDAVCVVDEDGRYLYVSAGFERILGYPAAEVLGRQAFEFVHPEDRTDTIHQAAEVTAGAIQRHFRNRYVHKDGHLVDMQWSASWYPQFRVRIGVGREATELRRVQQELEHLASHD